MTTYSEWIQALKDSRYPVTGQCRELSNRMISEFPELELRGGWVNTRFGMELHYWCKSPDGKIVDPTKHQFFRCEPGEEDYVDADSTDPMVLLAPFLVKDGDWEQYVKDNYIG